MQGRWIKATGIILVCSFLGLGVIVFGQMQMVRNLGSIVNSKDSDFGPIVSADGMTLYFTSDRAKGGTGGQDVWMSKKVKGEWAEPVNLGRLINTTLNEGPDCLSADEQTMYLTACNREDGLGGCDIYISTFDGKKWRAPKNLGEPINSKYNDANASLTLDGKTMYFVSTRPGGLGGWDIWVSHKTADGKWGEPKNLGEKINTPQNEIYAFIHWDGVSLYFSSDGRGGFGSADLFRSELKEGNWTDPVNLGPGINSADKDMYITIPASGDLAYLTSNRSDTIGEEDIYVVPIDYVLRPKAVSLIKGKVGDIESCAPPTRGAKPGTKVYDIETCKPLEASIRISDAETDEEIALLKTKADGSYQQVLTAGEYIISAFAEGYAFHSERLDISLEQPYQEVEKNILLHPLKVGAVVVLNNIYFDFDKATLRPESKTELNNLIKLLNENPNMEIEIRGHTDSTGSDEYNLALSNARAKSVVDYLVDVGGIDKKRLSSIGFGEKKPIASNATAQGRQLNRRVEFKVKKK